MLDRCLKILEDKSAKPVMCVVKGSRLWGWAEPDADWDIIGVHIDGMEKVVMGKVGIKEYGKDFIEYRDGELDFVSYEIGKFCGMISQYNGNIIEDIFAPVIFCNGVGEKMREIGKEFATKKLYNYYRGFAKSQAKKSKERLIRKGVIYTYREYLAGIHFLKTGHIEFDVKRLFEIEPFDSELLGWALNGFLDGVVFTSMYIDKFFNDVVRLEALLDEAYSNSTLPEENEGSKERLNSFLWGVRNNV
jgi:uncharacterized protein